MNYLEELIQRGLLGVNEKLSKPGTFSGNPFLDASRSIVENLPFDGQDVGNVLDVLLRGRESSAFESEEAPQVAPQVVPRRQEAEQVMRPAAPTLVGGQRAGQIDASEILRLASESGQTPMFMVGPNDTVTNSNRSGSFSKTKFRTPMSSGAEREEKLYRAFEAERGAETQKTRIAALAKVAESDPTGQAHRALFEMLNINNPAQGMPENRGSQDEEQGGGLTDSVMPLLGSLAGYMVPGGVPLKLLGSVAGAGLGSGANELLEHFDINKLGAGAGLAAIMYALRGKAGAAGVAATAAKAATKKAGAAGAAATAAKAATKKPGPLGLPAPSPERLRRLEAIERAERAASGTKGREAISSGATAATKNPGPLGLPAPSPERLRRLEALSRAERAAEGAKGGETIALDGPMIAELKRFIELAPPSRARQTINLDKLAKRGEPNELMGSRLRELLGF